jgi:hypothetical protein
MRNDRSTRLPRAARSCERPHGYPRKAGQRRRGSALFLALVMTVALGGLAISAVFLASNTSILNKNLGREQDYRYAAEAAIAIGKSRVNNDSKALPQTGYSQLMSGQRLDEADGATQSGVTVNLWVGKSGATTGQFGSFASVVAEARDIHGSRFVRRLELTEENFAKYAYWSDRETNMSGTTIYFNNNDVLWGPVWSNDVIHIGSGRATFNDEVGTAKTIDGKQYGTFKRTVLENQKPIQLPDNENLAHLETQATSGNLLFQAPDSGGPGTVRMRLEFVAVNLNPLEDNDVMDDEEGFLRVYRAYAATGADYVRGDFTAANCGDWHRSSATARWKFYPAIVHHRDSTWFIDTLTANNTMSLSTAQSHAGASFSSIMTPVTGRPGPRCFVGGDPHLVAVERNDPARFTPAERQKGGEDTTFTAVGARGEWLAWPNPPDAKLNGRYDAAYLYPLYRSLNEGVKGVIVTRGTVGLSGVLRGRITIHARSGNLVLLDDTRYASDPKDGECLDMLGMIADKDIVVADNAVNTPQNANGRRNYDDTKDFHLHSVMMALGSSFRVEDYEIGVAHVNGCEGTKVERGCLYLAGGIIQRARGAVGTTISGGATGFSKRYSYDRCALRRPPPYYPTTGRFGDNRYYEVDPVGFDIATLFAQLTATPP